jgi:hypothetical protein
MRSLNRDGKDRAEGAGKPFTFVRENKGTSKAAEKRKKKRGT